MDATKMLVSVSKFAIGWMVGMWAYKSFMSGGSMSAPSTPSATTTPTAPAFGYDGDDY
jgi:hypothetical protein